MAADDAVVARLQKDVEDLVVQMRAVNQGETARDRKVEQDIRELAGKIAYMDVHGTSVTQVKIDNIAEDVKELKEESKSIRTTVRSALITAGFAIAVGIIEFAILRSQGG